MNLLDIILLAVALAMDCFTVSIVSGVICTKESGVRSQEKVGCLRMAFLFGFFQALMPLIGWLLVIHFAASLATYGHWLAFALLLFIGGKMIWESLQGDKETTAFHPHHLPTQLLLAVATSIDALAIGVSMAVTGYTSFSQLWWPLTVIGVVSLLMSLLGHRLGISFGKSIARRIKPELIGGIILIVLGIKALLD